MPGPAQNGGRAASSSALTNRKASERLDGQRDNLVKSLRKSVFIQICGKVRFLLAREPMPFCDIIVNFASLRLLDAKAKPKKLAKQDAVISFEQFPHREAATRTRDIAEAAKKRLAGSTGVEPRIKGKLLKSVFSDYISDQGKEALCVLINPGNAGRRYNAEIKLTDATSGFLVCLPEFQVGFRSPEGK